MNWQQLLSAIPYRLNRDDLPPDFVLEMALERVSFYGPLLFFPAERTDYSITLQPGQQFYTLPPGTQSLRNVRVLYNGVWINVPFYARYSDALQADVLQPPFTSLPVTACTLLGNQLRVFPTPNQQYPLELTMFGTIPAPTDLGDDTNFWVNDGRILLINSACGEICRERLDIAVPNSPRIAIFDRNTEEALQMLMVQTQQFGGPSLIRSWL